jgi:hypothetical protein
VHPGGIATELGRYAYAEPDALQKRLDQINAEHAAVRKPAFSLKSVPQGAGTSVSAGVVAPADVVGVAIARTAMSRNVWKATSSAQLARACAPMPLISGTRKRSGPGAQSGGRDLLIDLQTNNSFPSGPTHGLGTSLPLLSGVFNW